MPLKPSVKIASDSNRVPPEYKSSALRLGHSFRRRVFCRAKNLKLYDSGTLVQILCFWTLSIVLFILQ
jgi:hypothetical protein